LDGVLVRLAVGLGLLHAGTGYRLLGMALRRWDEGRKTWVRDGEDFAEGH